MRGVRRNVIRTSKLPGEPEGDLSRKCPRCEAPIGHRCISLVRKSSRIAVKTHRERKQGA